MLYEWTGRKPHRRYQNVMAPGGRGKTRVARVQEIEIKPGEVFEPTPDELTYFQDMMRPVGESLRYAAVANPKPDDDEDDEGEELRQEG